MKKFGTPIGAGPTVADENVGFVGAGGPGGGGASGVPVVGSCLLLRAGALTLEPRGEVEVECFLVLTTFFTGLDFFFTGLDFLVVVLRLTPFAGPATGSGCAPAPTAAGAGSVVAVCSGDGA